MKLRTRKAIIASTMIISLNVSANDSIYIVKKGDTLSSILLAKQMGPIYGKHGALAETLRLNPKIRPTGGNRIFPKMKIVLIDLNLANKVITEEKQNIQLANHETNLGEIKAKKTTANDRLPSDDFKQSFYWEVSPTLSWKNLSSTDENVYRSSQINALSNTNYGMSATYGMHFKEDVDLYSTLSLESVSFAHDSSINLVKSKFTASRFGMGLDYEKKWQLELAMSDRFFLISPSSSSVEIKKVTLPELKASYLKDFYQYRNAQLSYLLSGNVFLPRTSPGIESKISYGAGGALEAKLHNQAFRIGYDLNWLKASNNSTNNQNIYWKYIWETP